MAIEVVTSSMLSELVAYLKANCYTASEIGAAAQADLETLSNSSIAISSVEGLIRRTDTASGGVMGVPMIGISYDPKIDRFLASIGERPAGRLEAITVDDLMQDIRRRWQDKETFQQKNAPLMARLRDLAAKNAELALELIKE